jgi:hypothetical protein
VKKELNILLSIFIVMCLVTLSIAEDNEKALLLNSTFFGKNIAKAKKVKKSGKAQLQSWESYKKWAESVPNDLVRKVVLQHTDTLNIEYDEIWIVVMDDLFNTAEKKKWRGQFDISTIYWQHDKVQASTLEKYFVADPVTGKKLGKHKITQVWDRDSLLKDVSN